MKKSTMKQKAVKSHIIQCHQAHFCSKAHFHTKAREKVTIFIIQIRWQSSSIELTRRKKKIKYTNKTVN